MSVKPIFLLSVSRSGSTLVQRIMAAHAGVATVSEPWLLLPLVYTLRREGVLAEYVHPLMVDAIEDFYDELPQGREEYLREAREFSARLYARAAGDDATHFVDKSPPYCLVAEEIMQLFPECKFVFLWRNPLSIIASMLETWLNGRWHPTMFRSDLFIGLPRLVAAYDTNPGHSYSARFEDLVAGEESDWRPLMEYLEIEFDPSALEGFSTIELRGRMGDPTGTKTYSSLSSDPSEKWRGAFTNPIRKSWAKRYLRFLGARRLEIMGYSLDQLLRDLDAQPTRSTSLLSDLGRAALDIAKEPLRPQVQRAGLGGPNVIGALLRPEAHNLRP
jgi:sulfotransferase family protein